MASVKIPLLVAAPLKQASARALSAQAATKSIPVGQRLAPEEMRSTTLDNGLTIHSVENYTPISRIVVVAKAGSRYENGDNQGATHVIRAMAGASTKNSTTFAITKNIEWIGGNFYAACTRDHIIYTLECNRDDSATAMKFLNDTVFAPAYNHWDLDDTMPRLKQDLAALSKNQGAQLMEALHQASFRGGLSHSLFIHPSRLSKIRATHIQEFAKHHITGPRTVVSAAGVDHERLVHVLKNLKIASSSADEAKASRFNPSGGGVRVEFPAQNTMVALAMEACGLSNPKDAYTMEVLKHVLGMSKARVPYSNLEATRLGKAALSSKPSNPFSIGSFTATYADNGMFGVAMAANAKEVGAIAKAAVGAMREVGKGNLQDADIAAAKIKAKFAVAKRQTKPTKVAMNTAVQQLTQGAPMSYAEVERTIDNITKQDVAKVAEKMTRVKPSMAVVGRLYHVPHLDEILQ